MYLILIDAIRSMAISAVVIHVMPYLSHVGISRPTASLVAAAIPLCSIAGRFGFGWMADVFEKKYVMAMTYFLMGIGLVAFCYVQVKWFMFLFLLLFPLGLGGSMVLRGVILRDYFGTSSFGTMLGIVSGSASIGAIIGPTLAGWVFDTLRNYQFAWLALIVLIALAILMILGIKKPKTNH
jgi:MFS family permease